MSQALRENRFFAILRRSRIGSQVMFDLESHPDPERLVRVIAALTYLDPRTVRAALTQSKRVTKAAARAVSLALPKAQVATDD